MSILRKLDVLFATKAHKYLECPSLRSIIDMEVSSSITPTDYSSNTSDTRSRSTTCDYGSRRPCYFDRSCSYSRSPNRLDRVFHLDLTNMMIGTTIIGLVVAIGTIRIGVTTEDTTITDLAGQIAILHSLKKYTITTMIITLHLVDSGKVKDKIRVKTRVITILEVRIKILTINVIT